MGRLNRSMGGDGAAPVLDADAWDAPDELTSAECAAELGDDRLRTPDRCGGEDDQ